VRTRPEDVASGDRDAFVKPDVNATDGRNWPHRPAVISMKEVAGGPDLVLAEAWERLLH
jgi:hypothetical protein